MGAAEALATSAVVLAFLRAAEGSLIDTREQGAGNVAHVIPNNNNVPHGEVGQGGYHLGALTCVRGLEFGSRPPIPVFVVGI